LTLPARHREKAGKLYHPAVQRMGAVQVTARLLVQLDKLGGNVTGRAAPLRRKQVLAEDRNARMAAAAVSPHLIEVLR
jgi:hypothetical protein